MIELTRANISLLMDWPLFGQIILHLQWQEAAWCKTAATDGRYIYYDRAFIESLGRQELLFLAGHEVAHVLLDHVFRRGERDRDLFNMAADLIANDLLIKQKVGVMPKGGLYDPRYSSDIHTVETVSTIFA